MTTTEPGSIGHVLAATDFSATADAGVIWAASVARLHRARLTLVHAIAPILPAGELVLAPPVDDRELVAVAQERLARIAERPELADLEVECAARRGAPAERAILDVAEDLGVDLVVIGTRGLTGLKHLLLGSTAERIVQGARVPVLAVHPDDRHPERQPEVVLVPTDFSEDAEEALDAADRVLACVGERTRVILLHVYHVPVEYRTYGAAATFSRTSDELAETFSEQMEGLARRLRPSCRTVETVIREGVPSEVIVREARSQGAELVAMGTHGRSGLTHLLLGSTAERVVQHAPCPVLVSHRREG